MPLSDMELQLAKADYDKLGNEIAYLKQCQVKLIEIALIIVGAYAAILGLRSGKPQVDSISIIAGCFVVYSLSVLGWLILHKSGSAFRAIAWSKIVEGFMTERPEFAGLTYMGYETCYQRVRLSEWLDEGTEVFKDLGNVTGGVDSVKKQRGRIGDYYRKVTWILAWPAIIVVLSMLALSAVMEGFWLKCFFLALTCVVALYAYASFRALLCKICVRLEGFPLSIQAWYVMFLHVLATEAGVIVAL